MTLQESFTKIAVWMQYMSVVPIGLGLLRWGQLDWGLRWLWLNLVVTLLISIASEYLISQHIDNTPLFYLTALTDGLLMILFLSTYLTPTANRWLWWGLFGLLMLFMVWTVFAWGASFINASLIVGLENGLVFGLAVVILSGLIAQFRGLQLRGQSSILATIGALIVSLLMFILYLFGTQLYTYSVSLYYLLWNAVAPLASLSLYVLTCLAFWKSR